MQASMQPPQPPSQPPRPHVHPHARTDDDPDAPPRLGIVGGGSVGRTLARAFAAAGWPVVAGASRSESGRAALAAAVPGMLLFPEAAAVLDEVEICILTVPDDAIAAVAGGLRLYGGQALVHTSGLLESTVLEPAMAAGTLKGSFHPLVAFAHPDRALAALPGATIAVEGDAPLVPLLGQLAEAIGGQPVSLPPGAKPAYHAAAVLAAGGLIGLYEAIVALGRGAGLDEAAALAVYAPLSRQALADAQALGVAAALTGPIVRGDVGTLRAHLEALRSRAPAALDVYRAVAAQELVLAVRRGALDDRRAAALATLLGGRLQGAGDSVAWTDAEQPRGHPGDAAADLLPPPDGP
ncbi:MAG TPA: DUF2520 domain-containing protein [Candidatus Limnocylindrales bacterium]|nr:DUF2520 domain-containing protein [Candidatus Limnocylindrales bacterium]